jgi:hypothetical protein
MLKKFYIKKEFFVGTGGQDITEHYEILEVLLSIGRQWVEGHSE